MKIILEESLSNFKFWSGGADSAELLTEQELDVVESVLDDLYPDGMTDTEINDLFWFDFETVLDWIGLTEEELDNR